MTSQSKGIQVYEQHEIAIQTDQDFVKDEKRKKEKSPQKKDDKNIFDNESDESDNDYRKTVENSSINRAKILEQIYGKELEK